LWVPQGSHRPANDSDVAARLEYLDQRRKERNVTFQAVFLHALGRLGFSLGESVDWSASTAVLDKLERLASQSWKAYAGADPEGRDLNAYDPDWVRAMMRPHVDRETGEIDGYVFDHSDDKIRATEERLATLLDSSAGA
jgi:hypothetical protein